MNNIVRFFLKWLLLVWRGEKVMKICWLVQKFQKQMRKCWLCTFLEEKNTFTNKEGSDTYKTREGFHLDCNSEHVIYLIICKKCKKQYVRSCITSFRTRFNDYRSCHRTFCRDHFVIQVSFHPHFLLWYRRMGNHFNWQMA